MLGLWLEDRKLRLRHDLPIPTPPPGEVLVDVLMAGICNTDLELTRGYYPFAGVPGHEFVGTVNGTRVVGEINAACHRCEACRRGHATHCDNRTVLGLINRNGAFAEHLMLPEENLHVVPDSVSTEEAIFAEPLAAALQIQEQVRIASEDRVVVVGDGKLGQLVAQTLALTGCRLTVVGRHPEKLALLERYGIETAQSLDGEFDVAVDCSGSAQGFAIARQALRARGTLIMKSTYAGELTVNASSLVVDEITLVGSRCGPMAKALRLLETKAVDVRSLLHATYTLREAVVAFQHAQRAGTLKVAVRID